MDRAILYTCVRVRGARMSKRRDERELDGRWCYNLRESLVEIVRESTRGTLDLRFAGYRCRTSKEERRVLVLSQKQCAKPMTYSLSLSLPVHLLFPPSFPPPCYFLLFLLLADHGTKTRSGRGCGFGFVGHRPDWKEKCHECRSTDTKTTGRGAARPKILARRSTVDRIRKSESRLDKFLSLAIVPSTVMQRRPIASRATLSPGSEFCLTERCLMRGRD